ncbi:mercury resistance system periplasmic binding protein MerP [Massilia varians]|jgi:mercuric ion binding protein|uniref:Periplasmic mercury ion-binding protein n=2 Tax=Massilia TaxID=149698 RepID=A0ABT2ARX2_9BURK|nr:mercury resistance system periplasmic binding protein MerP [Massilia agri]MCS0598997.1 mercury resistance system periplasmic binding protein MerP [Massilia agri]QOY92527.1 mercury resistance system periplasmic binding protein MerP [Massilia sp. UMI-21]
MHFFNIAIAGILLASPAIAGTSQTLTLDVQNMSCATCPITVKKALQRVPGVIDVKIDYERKTATVQLDSDKASVTILTKATTDAGFPSTARKVQ